MSELGSPGESQRGTPRFFVGEEDDESEGTDYGCSMRTEVELYEDDEEADSPPERQIVMGICCMMKKSKSKPMTQILERLCRFEYITVVIFPEDVILNEPVEKWPLCDCLISFHSKGLCQRRRKEPNVNKTVYLNDPNGKMTYLVVFLGLANP
ncbi:hypothetical protein ACEWY4_015210 [Coilia grayii]|uniref:VIP1 N-terminal domain-containing protein n=1 Tax=Coilia grayii TaxID=363190 RepID=A0ABD1JPL1_9TELE